MENTEENVKRAKVDHTNGHVKIDMKLENGKVSNGVCIHPRADEKVKNTEEITKYVHQPFWSRDTWKSKPVAQHPFVLEELSGVLKKLSVLPPIAHPIEIDRLRSAFEDVYYGRKFVLQGGDCAEIFNECTGNLLDIKLKIILQMSLIISWAAKIPVVKIGRIAGQFAKPRSAAEEIVNGEKVYTYRGDCVNGIEPHDRKPNPKRLLGAYFHSVATLNYVRSQLACGFADLNESKHWKLDYVMSSEQRAEYRAITEQLLNSLDFMETCGVGFDHEKHTVDFFTSHEALILPYEEALTREYQDKMYDTSAHFLWIGDRTRQLDHGHVEFCRGLENPIGVKVGPSSSAEEIVQICKILNPQNLPGKVVLITRFGAKVVAEMLPSIVQTIKESGVKVVWLCDPMHGNTETTSNKIKTRKFDNIFRELMLTLQIHRDMGTLLGGVHFEMTGENVTECIGGPQELKEMDLTLSYTSHCDPRLNYAQSMHIAFEIAKELERKQEI